MHTSITTHKQNKDKMVMLMVMKKKKKSFLSFPLAKKERGKVFAKTPEMSKQQFERRVSELSSLDSVERLESNCGIVTELSNQILTS